MSVGQICSRVTATAAPGESVRAAARRMKDYDVGTLVVLKQDRGSRAIGIITDRDIALRCVAAELDPDEAVVADVMTTPVHSIQDGVSVQDALAKMAHAGTRRLVVLEDGERVAGILSLDDVLEHVIAEVSVMRELLAKQQPRVPA